MTHANWMSKLPDALKSCPLSEIAIPGTHDSGTSDINMKSEDGPDLKAALKKFEKYTCCIAKKFIVNFSVTQNVGMTEQMNEGIRYLDLRLAYDKNTNDFYFTHGLLSTRLSEALEEIRGFMVSHPGEVVLLDFNHFYAMTDNLHVAACRMIMKFLSDQLYPMPFGTVTIPSLNQCVEAGKRVLLFYHTTVKGMPFWYGGYIPSPWGNVNSASKMIEFLEKNYNDGRPYNRFYVSQGVVTPDKQLIIKHPFSTIRDISDKANPKFVEWVSKKNIGPQGINVCIVDFFQDFEVVPTILALNK